MAHSSSIEPGDHIAYMRFALSLAKQAPPKPTNFCVGAILVDETSNLVLSTGYTMELSGNTHAEQCCLCKFKGQSVSPRTGTTSPMLVLYTTMEPCHKRASGNGPCTETILAFEADTYYGKIEKVYVGVKEPEKFVGENVGRARLEEMGVEYIHIPGLETEILAVATAGHSKS